MFASTTENGQALAVPDVCKTPSPAGPVPVPYPNTGMCNQARGNSVTKKVKICLKPALTKKSIIVQSSGDEPGTAGGVISGQNKGPVSYKTFSQKVYLEGAPAVFLSCTTAHNGNNANCPVGAQIAPSQNQVIVGG